MFGKQIFVMPAETMGHAEGFEQTGPADIPSHPPSSPHLSHTLCRYLLGPGLLCKFLYGVKGGLKSSS